MIDDLGGGVDRVVIVWWLFQFDEVVDTVGRNDCVVSVDNGRIFVKKPIDF